MLLTKITIPFPRTRSITTDPWNNFYAFTEKDSTKAENYDHQAMTAITKDVISIFRGPSYMNSTDFYKENEMYETEAQ